jgi:hypothetical protein
MIHFVFKALLMVQSGFLEWIKSQQNRIVFVVLTAVTMKTLVFWDVMLCSLEKAECFRGMYYTIFRVEK